MGFEGTKDLADELVRTGTLRRRLERTVEGERGQCHCANSLGEHHDPKIDRDFIVELDVSVRVGSGRSFTSDINGMPARSDITYRPVTVSLTWDAASLTFSPESLRAAFVWSDLPFLSNFS